MCVLVLALATRVEFRTPIGYTVPSQMAFVPLLFVIPLALVPPAVVVAYAIARVDRMVRGELSAGRVLVVIPNAWFAIGPVAVFTIAGVEPRDAGAALLITALVAEFAVDFLVSALRDVITRTVNLRAALRESGVVYAVDATLSGIGLVVAQDLHHAPAEILFLVPVLGLFAVFAHERSHRLRDCSSSTAPTAEPRSCSATSSSATITTPASTPEAWSSWRLRSPNDSG